MWFDTKMQIIKKMKVEIRRSINLLQKIFLISPKFIALLCLIGFNLK